MTEAKENLQINPKEKIAFMIEGKQKTDICQK